MAIAEVRKIHLLVHREESGAVVRFLQRRGAVELAASTVERRSGPEQEMEEVGRTLQRLSRSLATLRPYGLPVPFRDKVFATRPILTHREIDDIASSFDLEGFLSSLEEKIRRRGILEEEIGRAGEEQRELRPWAGLGVAPADLKRLDRIDVIAGRFPAARLAKFRDRVGGHGHLEICSQDGRWAYGLIFCHGEGAAAMRAEMNEAGFAESPLHELESLPEERIARLDEEIRQNKRSLADIQHACRRMAGGRRDAHVMYDVLAGRLERLRGESLMVRTARTVSIEGWAAARELPDLRRALKDRFPLASIADTEPQPHERIPVILENVPLVRPFGLVVDLYGLPRYGSIDPSAVMAGFFALFFGLCLTDAGYGIFLAAVTGALLVAMPSHGAAGRRRFFQMIFLCGIATTAAGAAAGGWFGLQSSVRLFDPLENLMFFFLLALVAGTLHIFAGLGLRMVRLARAGDPFGAVVDHGLWMVLILAVYGLTAARGGALPPSAGTVFAAIAVAAALGIVLFQGRPGGEEAGRWTRHLPWAGATLAGTLWFAGYARPWPAVVFVLLLAAAPPLTGVSFGRALGRIGLGLYALYGVTGYLSDVLSYSRLVALGLATGIIALVVNKMAVLAGGIPYVGMVMAVLVLLGGHMFNIAINLLGAFVHSCRLQYVEFFTKFYESGGRPFSPFRLETRYITIREKT